MEPIYPNHKESGIPPAYYFAIQQFINADLYKYVDDKTKERSKDEVVDQTDEHFDDEVDEDMEKEKKIMREIDRNCE